MGAVTNHANAVDPRLSQVGVSAPKVSVIVTNYNYGGYVCDCLQSVARQSYPDVECLVVDDQSSDDSVERIRKFIDKDESHVTFRLVVHDQNRGQYAAFHTGLRHTSGAFVTFLDADDLLLPDFISEHVRVHLSKPPVAFTSSNQFQIDSDGQVIGGLHPDLHARGKYRLISTVALHRPFWVWATSSSMMFRRQVLELVMADANGAFRKCADNYLCHFCNMLGNSILIPGVYGCYRRHGRNYFSNNPLIGGRLPTGDMRNHPKHETVLDSIRARLVERGQEFVSVLGEDGVIGLLARITPLSSVARGYRTLGKITGCNPGWQQRSLFLWQCAWLSLRVRLRRLLRRFPCVSIANLDRLERMM
jgi:glycosyltransferase involved in cell wall biosynthesis